MKRVISSLSVRRTACLALALLLAFPSNVHIIAQTAPDAASIKVPAARPNNEPSFRLERLPVASGAELLTIFGTLDGLPHEGDASASVPLVSVLRDTLNDADGENDRLRYVWMLTHTRPSLKQRVAAGVPFLYARVGNKSRVNEHRNPPPIIDLGATDHQVWDNVFWTALQNVFLDTYGLPFKLATRTYRRNVADYRRAHIMRALAILSLYQSETGTAPVLNAREMQDIQARLMLTEKALGGIVDDIYLQRVYRKQTTESQDTRGHNWELLRQRSEAEGLYFEPLELPDGSATHALVWAAREDLAKNQAKSFESRFLNIANPWNDKKLQSWKGYVETRYFDADNRPVTADTTGARPVEMIPLALYGLDHPKIPALLVDFRDGTNAKKREMSRRVLQDVTRNILALSRFGDIPYFLGRTIYDFTTSRRGMDINQPTRLRAYTQLKLLLSLDASLDPSLRAEIEGRMESISLNPMENDYQTEAQLAREQYAALLDYAGRADGLPAHLDRDRRSEMVALKHGPTQRTFFRIANVITFGRYTHREDAAPVELQASLDLNRRLDYHTRFLREVVRSTPQIEVVWNVDEVKRSLKFIAEHGEKADSKTASAVTQIFSRTDDEEARTLCINGLYRINNETAKNELLKIYRDEQFDAKWRPLIAEYLRRALHEEQRIAREDAKVIQSMIGQ